MVGYGTVVPEGRLCVYSVGTEAEAKKLIVLACPRDLAGNFIAPELAREQTLENLDAFSERLHRAHELLKQSGECTCSSNPATPTSGPASGPK